MPSESKGVTITALIFLASMNGMGVEAICAMKTVTLLYLCEPVNSILDWNNNLAAIFEAKLTYN